MKAHELIDSPEKWCCGSYSENATGYGSVTLIVDNHVKLCAAGAYAVAYDCSIRVAEDKLNSLLDVRNVDIWNDTVGWNIVYETLKGKDI
jgi:hypothetical protein